VGTIAALSYDALNPNVHLVKLDTKGKLVWTRTFGTDKTDLGTGIAVSADGSIYVSGQTNGAFLNQKRDSAYDGFLTKFDLAGNQKWVRQFQQASMMRISNVAVNRTGGALIANGVTLTEFDGTGRARRTVALDLPPMNIAHIAIQSDDTLIVAGVGKATGASEESHAFVAGFDPTGSRRWQRLVDVQGESQAVVNVLTVDDHGNTFVGGTYGSILENTKLGEGCFVARLAQDGQIAWLETLGSSAASVSDRYCGLNGLAPGQNQRLYMVGFVSSFESEPLGAQGGGFLARINTNGGDLEIRRTLPVGGEGIGVYVDGNGSIYALGHVGGVTKDAEARADYLAKVRWP
jgi:outer membrane protein assembly factor BamB